MMGTLVILDAYECRNIPKGQRQLLEWALEAVREAKMRPVETVARHFSRDEWQSECGDSVMTLIVPLMESHLAIHTWPTYQFVAVDLFTCGDFQAAYEAVCALERRLQPKRGGVHCIFRGKQIKKGDGK